MKIERRLPFGFVGDWGVLYKRYTNLDGAKLKDNVVITCESNTYRDIGMDVQFKLASDASVSNLRRGNNIIISETYTTVETTDAYFDDVTKSFSCIVEPGDVVKVFGRLWMCESVTTKSKFVPAKHDFFYCDLKSIL